MHDQVLEEVERRGIEPLQIVQKQRERVLLPREYAEEAPDDHLEAARRVLRRQGRGRGPTRECRGGRRGRRPPARCGSHVPARTAAPGSADGPTHLAY